MLFEANQKQAFQQNHSEGRTTLNTKHRNTNSLIMDLKRKKSAHIFNKYGKSPGDNYTRPH